MQNSVDGKVLFSLFGGLLIQGWIIFDYKILTSKTEVIT